MPNILCKMYEYMYVRVCTHTNIYALENMFCLKFWVTFRKMMIHWTIYRMSLCYCHFNWRAHFLVFYYHKDFGRLICAVFKTKFLISHIMIIMSWQRYLYFVISYFSTVYFWYHELLSLAVINFTKYRGKNDIFQNSIC